MVVCRTNSLLCHNYAHDLSAVDAVDVKGVSPLVISVSRLSKWDAASEFSSKESRRNIKGECVIGCDVNVGCLCVYE